MNEDSRSDESYSARNDRVLNGFDLVSIHRGLLREQPEPAEGFEWGPWWLWTAIILTLFAGGFYLGRFSGVFFQNAVHIGYLFLPLQNAQLAPHPATKSDGASADLTDLGARTFSSNCLACHQENGEGLTGPFPSLVASPWVVGPPETLLRILIGGLSGSIEVKGAIYNGQMPAWRTLLSDEQLAAVSSYVRKSWGNQAEPISTDFVKQFSAAEPARSNSWTARELKAKESTSK